MMEAAKKTMKEGGILEILEQNLEHINNGRV
jgi:hypothetical protein